MPSAIDPALQMAALTQNDKKRPYAGDESPRKSKKTKSAYKSDEMIADSDDEVEEKKAKKEKRDKKDKSEKKEKKEKKDNKEKKDKKDKKDKSEKEKKEKKEKKDKDKKDKKDKKSTLSAPSLSLLTPSTVSPFFTQTVSLWLPLYPVGFDRPITSAAHQHLDALVNHYSPLLGGYLLAYRNLNLGEKAVRANPANPPTDATPATLASVDEYAVGFGWLTADVDLFVPSRGAALEGKVILQNEGAIGVNCWEKFNASIEAARLPSGWQYIEYAEGEGPAAAAAAAAATSAVSATSTASASNKKILFDDNDDAPDQSMMDADAAAAQIAGEAAEVVSDPTEAVPATTATVAGDLEELQSTGYWVDEQGQPVTGTVQFRIKDFDVGLAGDNGYLAIEGTMLSALDELKLKQQERERLRKGVVAGGYAGRKTRRLNEFSITQFGKEDEDEESGRRVDVYKGSRPGSPE